MAGGGVTGGTLAPGPIRAQAIAKAAGGISRNSARWQGIMEGETAQRERGENAITRKSQAGPYRNRYRTPEQANKAASNRFGPRPGNQGPFT